MIVVVLWTKPFGLYRHRRGLGLYKVGYRERNQHIRTPTLQKKDTSVTFWAERNFSCHAYDTSMTIIVTKPGIIIDVVGSTSMTKNHDRKWAFRPGRAGDAAA